MRSQKPGSFVRRRSLPGWWFIGYVIVFVLFVATAVILVVVCGVNALVAIGAPATLSAAAVAVLRALGTEEPDPVPPPAAGPGS
ncbi:hypothetical protein ACFVMC_32880 [Nocardia sp. NPDC127579]|uniref:hypothetical protein n=1 Tax=Nocardia sp. NPDC127579 TaxID=3345402 RepID=UPI00364389D4